MSSTEKPLDEHSLKISWVGEGGLLLDEILSTRVPASYALPPADPVTMMPVTSGSPNDAQEHEEFATPGASPAPTAPGHLNVPAGREPTRKEWLDAGWRPTMPGQPPPTLAFLRASKSLPAETPPGDAPSTPHLDGLPLDDRSITERKERLTRIQARDGGIVQLKIDLGELSLISIDKRPMDPALPVILQVNVKDKERMATHLRALADSLA